MTSTPETDQTLVGLRIALAKLTASSSGLFSDRTAIRGVSAAIGYFELEKRAVANRETSRP